MENIEVKSKLNKRDLYKFYLSVSSWSILGIILYILIIICSFLLWHELNVNRVFFLESPYFQFAFTLLFAKFIVPYFSAKITFKKLNDRTYTFTPEGIIFNTVDSIKSEFKWASILKIIEYSEIILLFIDNNNIQFISKKAFSEKQFQQFKEILFLQRGINYKNKIDFNIEAIKSGGGLLRLILFLLLLAGVFYLYNYLDKDYVLKPPFIIKAGRPYIDSICKPEIISGKYDSIIPAALVMQRPDKNRAKFGIYPHSINCIYIDKMGSIWLGSNKMGICKLDENKFTYYSMIRGKADTGISCMAQDKAGNLWIGTKDGLTCFTGEYFATYTKISGSFGNIHTIYCMKEDRKGSLWFSSGKGICCYDGKEIINYRSTQGLCSNYIVSMAEDTAGNLWFGSGAGTSVKTSIPIELEDLANKIGGIETDSKTRTHSPDIYGGVSCFDGTTFKNYTTEQGLMSNTILKIMIGRNNTIWFLGFGLCRYDGENFLCFDNSNGFYSFYIISFFIDDKGRIWITGRNKTFESDTTETQLDEFTQLHSFQVNCADEDEQGNMWFGTASGELIKYDGKSLIKFQVF